MANLADHVLGQYKIVLFVDDVGLEQSAQKIAEKLFQNQNLSYETFNNNFEFPPSTSVILPPISKLELVHDDTVIISTVQKLKISRNVSHVFCWITTKNLKSRLLKQFLEHMANVVVTIHSLKALNILTKRKFGSVRIREFSHEIFSGGLELKEIKQTIQKKIEETPAQQPDKIGTFKIGDFNKSELEAKNSMKLPFEIM
jgi:hypothetical protein